MPEKLAGLVLQEEVRQWAGYICAGGSTSPAFSGLEFALASPARVHQQHPSEARLLVMSTRLWVKSLNALWTSCAWSSCASLVSLWSHLPNCGLVASGPSGFSIVSRVTEQRNASNPSIPRVLLHSGCQFKAGPLLSLGGKGDGRLGLTEMVFLNDLVSNIWNHRQF